MKEIPINKKYLFACVVLALMLCLAQVTGYTMPIMACLGMYMILIAWCCCFNFTLPILLFFLPWSPLLKMDPAGYSFYTFAMVFICFISIIKRQFNFRNYQLKAGILVLLVTLFSKVLDGNGITFDYMAFVMMIFLFPSVKEEWREQKYDFYQVVTFFALGVVIAAMCALGFAQTPGIRRFIRVDAYLTIIRRSGFYGDANFYTAQILAAMGGVLSLFLQEKKKGRLLFMAVIVAFLLYCGLLSGSKSFVLVFTVLLVLWVIAIMRMRGKAGLKATLLIFLILGLVYIATSALFGGLITVIATRFSFAKNLNSFTTGRIGLWKSYSNEIFSNFKTFFLGQGFTNIKVNGRASHNTIIQMLFQFGVIGTAVLIYWIACFFRERKRTLKKRENYGLKSLIVAVGSFLPWIAIDALFFDEFFLLQWYMLVALNYFRPDEKAVNIEPVHKEENYGRENEE